MNVLILMESFSIIVLIQLVATTVYVLLAINSAVMGMTALVSVSTV